MCIINWSVWLSKLVGVSSDIVSLVVSRCVSYRGSAYRYTPSSGNGLEPSGNNPGLHKVGDLED